MHVTPEEFRKKLLRVHTFLTDVPLHDVWAFRLQGGGAGRTLRDFEALLSFEGMQQVNPVVNGLFKVRWLLGKWFGWDDERHTPPASSYLDRLTDDDRARSIEEPGSASPITGPSNMRWPPAVYSFENEALFEIVNFTVHAFLHMSMESSGDGYRVYWAVYINRTSWFTPVYMALIDPFRRIFGYPAIIRRIERAWAERYDGA